MAKKPKRKPLTPQQWATRRANQFVNAQIGGIKEQRKVYLGEVDKQVELERARGEALAQALQQMGLDKHVSGAYSTAAGDISGFAQGFSGGLRDVANAQAAEQQQALRGLDAGPVRNEGVAMSNVLYGANGFIPARSLSEQGAAFGAQAALEPSYAARQGALEASRVQREGNAGLADFTKAIIEARSGRPGLVQEFLDRRRGELADARDFQLKQQEMELDNLYKQAALANVMGDNARSDYYLKLAEQKEARMAAQARGVDMYGNPLPGFKKKGGRIVKAPTPSRAGKKGGVKWGDLQKDIAEDLGDLMITVKRPNPLAEGGFEEVDQKMGFKQAYNKLWAKYSGLVKDKARLRKMIIRLLASEGIKKPKPKPDPNAGLYPGNH